MFFSLFSALSLSAAPKIVWPKTYHLRGVWNIPYQNLHQPFEVFTDLNQGMQTRKVFGNLSMVIRYKDFAEWTIQSYDKHSISCLKSNSSVDTLTEYLPDLSTWEYNGLYARLGRKCHKWTKVMKAENNWYYEFYVDEKSLEPVQYYQHGRSILGSHPAIYTYDITEFGPVVSKNEFIVPANCDDRDAPGPTKFAHDISMPRTRKMPQQQCEVRKSKDAPVAEEVKNINEFSWKHYPNVLVKPRDQANCGSCWAQSAVEAISSQLSLKLNKPIIASIQQMMDCTWEGKYNFACTGGDGYIAYDEMKKRNIPIALESEFPYLGVAGFCPSNVTTAVGRVTNCYQFDFTDVADKEEKINLLKTAVYKNGPLMVYMKAGFDEFVAYQNGRFNDEKCKDVGPSQLDHGVLLTGWKKIDDHDTFEIMNSWSDFWGDNGYAYLDAEANCGIYEMALLPEVELI